MTFAGIFCPPDENATHSVDVQVSGRLGIGGLRVSLEGAPGTTPQRRAYERLSLLAFGKCKCYLISDKSISLVASVSIEMLSELRNHEFPYLAMCAALASAIQPHDFLG